MRSCPPRAFASLLAATLVACGASRRPAPPSPAPSQQSAAPRTLTIDPSRLQALLSTAERERSSAIVLVHHGEVIVDQRWGEAPLGYWAMSVSKSVVSMAVGRALALGHLQSLDVPVAPWIPGWSEDDRAEITLRHLLTHTSGLETTRARQQGDDILATAAGATLQWPVGEVVEYNNGAIDLVAALFPHIASERLDTFLERELFEPLGIEDTAWETDVHGHPYGAGELRIDPRDLARLGELMLNRGRLGDRQLLPADWVETSLAPGHPSYPKWGACWWRLADYDYVFTEASFARWARLGGDPSWARRAEPLLGQTYVDRDATSAALAEVLGAEDAARFSELERAHSTVSLIDRRQRGPLRGFYGEGWLGQYLVVIPEHDLVAVRMRAFTGEGMDTSQFDYREFPDDVAGLVSRR